MSFNDLNNSIPINNIELFIKYFIFWITPRLMEKHSFYKILLRYTSNNSAKNAYKKLYLTESYISKLITCELYNKYCCI